MSHSQGPCPAPRWLGRETTGPGMAIVFSGQACLVQTIENPELWEPAALGESASHIRGRIVVAEALVYVLLFFVSFLSSSSSSFPFFFPSFS